VKITNVNVAATQT